MVHWDANSPRLLENLRRLGRRVTSEARDRAPLNSEKIRGWQREIMAGLQAPDGEPFGVFRGEPGLTDWEAEIGGFYGTPTVQVAAALRTFDEYLSRRLRRLDFALPDATSEPTAREYDEIVELCAWAHGEWVRIHPFPNGNGRTARLLVNSIAQRYGLPAFMQLRPRPGVEYERVAAQAMMSNWQAAIPLFRKLLVAALAPSKKR